MNEEICCITKENGKIVTMTFYVHNPFNEFIKFWKKENTYCSQLHAKQYLSVKFVTHMLKTSWKGLLFNKFSDIINYSTALSIQKFQKWTNFSF